MDSEIVNSRFQKMTLDWVTEESRNLGGNAAKIEDGIAAKIVFINYVKLNFWLPPKCFASQDWVGRQWFITYRFRKRKNGVRSGARLNLKYRGAEIETIR